MTGSQDQRPVSRAVEYRKADTDFRDFYVTHDPVTGEIQLFLIALLRLTQGGRIKGSVLTGTAPDETVVFPGPAEQFPDLLTFRFPDFFHIL